MPSPGTFSYRKSDAVTAGLSFAGSPGFSHAGILQFDSPTAKVYLLP